MSSAFEGFEEFESLKDWGDVPCSVFRVLCSVVEGLWVKREYW